MLEPGLTRAELAHRVGIHRADFDRAFGYAPAKHGAMQTSVGIATASRLVGALGPCTVRTRGMLTPKDLLSDMGLKAP